MTHQFLLSLIIPVYNEETTIAPLLERLLPIIEKYSYELIFVDDGSTDKTAHIIKEEAKKNKNIKLLSFSRNFGHQAALTAGYQFAKGDCVITMDADCQDPPEIIPEMIEKWHNGVKIVYAKRSKREVDSFIKRTTAEWYYKVINFLSDTPIPQDVGDFRLLDKEVVQFINTLPENSKFLRGIVAWGGFPTEYVMFERQKRLAGTTHYTPSKMMNLALDGITSFSTKPLRLATYLGFITATVGFFYMVYELTRKIFFPDSYVAGWPSLLVSIMFIGGIQLITIGIIGEYISKIYLEVQRRPPFLLKEKVNV